MWRPSSLARFMPARTRSIIRLRSNSVIALTMSGSSRIEEHSRELRSERLGLLRISIP